MSNVVKLASSRERPAVRACGTCRFNADDSLSMGSTLCNLFRTYQLSALNQEVLCGSERRGWEALPPLPPHHPGIFERVWRFLFGGRA
jgi:hypothetical protein